MTPTELIALRKATGCTQTEFGDLIGLGLRAYQDLEAGRSSIRRLHALAIRQALQESARCIRTGEDFKRWRVEMGFTQQAAADALDLGKSTIELYERGSRRDDGRPVAIPLVVSLACELLSLRRKQD